ncbi:CAP domain-containing protein [Candidatus Thiodiazotropha sp. CDECU1]|uniref:CAP domain-containing protein n=1 Tax=Candidatus Thiodiazotropha sp. CDECU1 TaxID=3065865 RepID=UPI00292CDB7A|nr:CAP domain-containing protein [Candidatus Thiodiazotropha sp. CDECU1]
MEYAIYKTEGSRNSPLLKLSLYLLSMLGLIASFDISGAVWSPRETAVFDLVNQQRTLNNLPPLVQNDQLHDSARGHSRSMATNDFFSHTTLEGSNGVTFVDRLRDVGHVDWTYGGENIAGGHGRTFTPLEQMQPVDAAHSVMYGTVDIADLNSFFFTDPQDSWNSWDRVGDGITGAQWDAWYSHRREASNYRSDGGWMGSQGHRENILSRLFDRVGVGYFWESDDSAPILGDEDEITFPLHTYWTQDFTGDEIVDPVPLPGAFWLLGSALAGLFAVGHRRRETGSDCGPLA